MERDLELGLIGNCAFAALVDERAWSERRGCFAARFGGETVDASLLLMAELGIVAPSDPRFVATVDSVGRELKRGDYVFRYVEADDFDTPHGAFTLCTFWCIDALAQIGRRAEARTLFEHVAARCTSLGLLSEHLDPNKGEVWGNLPQTYSMVGIIDSAMRLSEPWEVAF